MIRQIDLKTKSMGMDWCESIYPYWFCQELELKGVLLDTRQKMYLLKQV
jgi:hypothetical protein